MEGNDSHFHQPHGDRFGQAFAERGHDGHRPSHRRPGARDRGDDRLPCPCIATVCAREVQDDAPHRKVPLHHGGECTGEGIFIAPDVGVVIERIGQRDPGAEGAAQIPLLARFKRRECQRAGMGGIRHQARLAA